MVMLDSMASPLVACISTRVTTSRRRELAMPQRDCMEKHAAAQGRSCRRTKKQACTGG